MSQENVETVRQALDSWDRRDRATWLALHDPDSEVIPSRHWPEPGAVRGREPAWEFYVNSLGEAFERLAVEDAELVDAGADKVLVHHPLASRGRASGARFEASVWAVVTFREGRIVREEWFFDRAEALEAAGLRD